MTFMTIVIIIDNSNKDNPDIWDTDLTILTIENLKPWQSLLSDN